jgi:hypothetical protein
MTANVKATLQRIRAMVTDALREIGAALRDVERSTGIGKRRIGRTLVWMGLALTACGVLVMLTQRGERSAIEGERA